MNTDVMVVIAVLTAFWVLPAVPTARVAGRHGHSPIVYVIACLIVGWPIALATAIVTSRRRMGRTRATAR
jgi:predicted membrane protein